MDKKTVSNAVVISLVLIIVFIYTAKLREDNRNLQQINNNQLNQLAGKDYIIDRLELKIVRMDENFKEKIEEHDIHEKLYIQRINMLTTTVNKLTKSGTDKPAGIGITPDYRMKKPLSDRSGSRIQEERLKVLKSISEGKYQKEKKIIEYDINDWVAPQHAGVWRFTAYTPTSDQTDGDPTKTASGRLSTPGFTVAVDRKYWPSGVIIYIQELGIYAVTDDTGSAVKGRNRGDIMVSDRELAFKLTGFYHVDIIYLHA